MMRLGDLATILRSKNAGIGHITIDMLFSEKGAYEAAKHVVNPKAVADAYGIDVGRITDFVYFDEGLAIKVTFLRPQISGGEGLGETDVYGSGQYAPLFGIPVPFSGPPADPPLRS